MNTKDFSKLFTHKDFTGDTAARTIRNKYAAAKGNSAKAGSDKTALARLTILSRILSGKTQADVAKELGWSQPRVCLTIQRLNKTGLAGLTDQRKFKSGRRKKVSAED